MGAADLAIVALAAAQRELYATADGHDNVLTQAASGADLVMARAQALAEAITVYRITTMFHLAGVTARSVSRFRRWSRRCTNGAAIWISRWTILGEQRWSSLVRAEARAPAAVGAWLPDALDLPCRERGDSIRPKKGGGMRGNVTHAGGVVFRDHAGGREYLVVKASRGQEWVLPKGHIEQGETPAAAALREVAEEAGVAAEIVSPLDVITYTLGGDEVRVRFFLMRAVAISGAHEYRAQEWLSHSDALQRLSFPEARQLLEQAARAAARVTS